MEDQLEMFTAAEPDGQIHNEDCLTTMARMKDCSINCCVTSPPYFGLRCYLPEGVRLRQDTPLWVVEELRQRGILPIDPTTD